MMEDLPEIPRADTDFFDQSDGLTSRTLRGEVEKILFESEESDYTVVLVKDSAGNVHTVVGSLRGVGPGQGIEAEGRWEQHKDYGRQFRVYSYQNSLPVSLEGIEKYLGSGIVKGLGKHNAKEIVKHFGAETLDVIENAPMRLSEVPGIGKKRILALRDAWKANVDSRNSRMYLQGLGISPACCARITAVYGAEAADKVRENPYALASDVKGIGFTTADAIAEKAGITKTDPKRLQAGILYTFTQVRNCGHVCMPRTDFIRFCSELLHIDDVTAEQALNTACSLMTAAVSRDADGLEMVYEPGLLRCEMELPALLAGLSAVPFHKGEKMQRYHELPGTLFSDEQLQAVRMTANNPLSIITGGPGVGKTTVVSEIVRRAQLAGLSIQMAAPTGRASKRMSETTGLEAKTIHRLLRWDPAKRRFEAGVSQPLPCDLLIVDEASMLDILLATALFRSIRPGTTVVIVGDSDQLPSVGPGNVLNDMISSRLIPVARLTRIFRQGAGSGIIRAAHAVNAGILPEVPRGPAAPDDFFWIEKDAPEQCADVIERLVCDRIPARYRLDPVTGIQVLTPMNRGICGTQSLNERLQQRLNPSSKMEFRSGERIFRTGDKLMQVTNNYDKGVFNGDSGILSSIDYNKKKFSVRFDSGVIEYDFFEADQLVLAYAVTIHKSQGSEFPAVVIPILTQHYVMLHRNLLYTGITRARRLMVLVGSRKAVSMAVNNAVAEPRFSLFRERIVKAFAEKGIEP